MAEYNCVVDGSVIIQYNQCENDKCDQFFVCQNFNQGSMVGIRVVFMYL